MNDQDLPRVVYMLGAGASAQALPMVKGIPAALKAHVELLPTYTPKHAVLGDNVIEGNDKSHINAIIYDYKNLIQSLADNSENHESIDTYAKKIFLKTRSLSFESEEMRRLKLGLSLFFAFLQAKHGKADDRYDGLLASLLQYDEGSGRLQLPSDVLILNWNYDQQLAIAFKEYMSNGGIQGSIEQLGICPLELLSVSRRIPVRVIQLNGMFCRVAKSNDIIPVAEPNGQQEDALVREVLKDFAHDKLQTRAGRGRLLLKFAWELEDGDGEPLKILCDRLQHCEELVVIGYSFPFFNRMIDRRILKHMPSLRHIYVQAPEGAAQDIIKTISTMPIPSGCKLEPYTNTAKFLLPPGL